MKLLKNTLNNAITAHEILSYHINVSFFVFHVDIRLQNESTSSLEFKEKNLNFLNRLKYAEHKMFCICKDVYKIYHGNHHEKIYEVLSTRRKNLQTLD